MVFKKNYHKTFSMFLTHLTHILTHILIHYHFVQCFFSSSHNVVIVHFASVSSVDEEFRFHWELRSTSVVCKDGINLASEKKILHIYTIMCLFWSLDTGWWWTLCCCNCHPIDLQKWDVHKQCANLKKISQTIICWSYGKFEVYQNQSLLQRGRVQNLKAITNTQQSIAWILAAKVYM